MALFEYVKEVISGKEALKTPRFMKEGSGAYQQLEELNQLLLQVKESEKDQISQDINRIQYGIRGEEQVVFELKNSHTPMIVLHDLFLEWDGLTTQIDFLIITKKCVFIIECKNLFGDIEIDYKGNFIRVIRTGKYYKKEGIYNPVTQNQRHMEMIKKLLIQNQSGIFQKASINNRFDQEYKSVIVLANPKTVLNDKYAKKEMKEMIIRGDQLIGYIKEYNEKSGLANRSDRDMEQLGQFFLELHKEQINSYYDKYKALVEKEPEKEQEIFLAGQNMEEHPLYLALKKYRTEQSQKEGVKPYCIYKNSQMEDLIKTMPKTLEQLKQIQGFGEKKAEKYGADILRVLQE